MWPFTEKVDWTLLYTHTYCLLILVTNLKGSAPISQMRRSRFQEVKHFSHLISGRCRTQVCISKANAFYSALCFPFPNTAENWEQIGFFHLDFWTKFSEHLGLILLGALRALPGCGHSRMRSGCLGSLQLARTVALCIDTQIPSCRSKVSGAADSSTPLKSGSNFTKTN